MSEQLVLFLPQLPADVIALARDLAPRGFRIEVADLRQDRESALRHLSRADYLLGFPYHLDEEAFAAAAENVKLIQLLSAGFDEIDVDAAARHGMPVATNGGANAIAVAEHTLMLVLACLKQLPAMTTAVLDAAWPVPNTYSSNIFELHGKTVGLIGLGQIGRRVAALTQAFGAEVVYFDVVRPEPSHENDLGVTYLPLDELLGRADVVSLHLPFSERTDKLIGSAEFGAMKKGAVLVNTARGQLIDEVALLGALNSGTVRVAALDTLTIEPASPADNPLVGHPSVITTPHSAGSTWDSWYARLRNGFANIETVEAGGRPRWQVGQVGP
ncbi:NAD(P)-dependent oxidoreductase [Mycobacterium sp. NPDC003449]